MTDTVNVPRDPTGAEVSDALHRLRVVRDQHRNGTSVTDPDPYDADELDAILEVIEPALAAAPKAEPVSNPQQLDVEEQFELAQTLAANCGYKLVKDDEIGAPYPADRPEAQKGEPVAVRDILYAALTDYTLTNMGCEDDPHIGYGLVDLFSNEGTDISTGRAELRVLADYLAETLNTHPAPSSDEPTKNLVWAVTHMREVLSRLQYSANEKDFEEARLSGVSIGDKAIAKHKGPQS